jgi:rhamnogalacturonyl hydrolase YesR
MAHHDRLLNTALDTLVTRAAGLWTLEACGVTRAQTPLSALVHRQAYAATPSGTRVLLVGGITGQRDDITLALQTLEIYLNRGPQHAETIALSAIPCANPDGLALGVGPGNGAGGQPGTSYPPQDNFFYDAHNPEQRYLWRWVGMQAPDLLLEIQAGSTVVWEASPAASPLAVALQARGLTPADALLAALGVGTPNGLLPLPGLRLTTSAHALPNALQQLWSLLEQTPGLRPSPARRCLDDRRARTPLQVARLLATVYGHTLEPVVYTQGMALSGRLRLAQLDPTLADPTAAICQLVEPYVSGAKAMFGATAGTATLAGLTWAYELAEATQDRRYAELILAVADRYRPAPEDSAPPPCDPDFRTEDMCMNALMLGRAFRLTGNQAYLDIQTRFLLAARLQQDHGLFWHCRSGPYYWGRGNGFAALGYCETLSVLPDDHPHRPALLAMHLRHLEALRQCQQRSGLYPQVLDVPGSYQEFTVTCMIGYAMARGLRRGWLEPSYQMALDLAWQGVTERLDESGGLVDCCTNTGVQSNLQAYLDRPAIFGRDDRGGAMALWFALEMAEFQREQRL